MSNNPGAGDFVTTSLSLIHRVKSGEEDAWSRLVQLYSPLVYSRCRSVGLSETDAQDAMQDVFKSVHRRVADFEREPGGSFRKWLRTITRNAAIDILRKKAGSEGVAGGSTANAALQQVPDTVDDEETDSDESELQGLMKRALELIRNEFEEVTWKAFWLTTVEEQKAVDVARDLDMQPGTVRNARYKVMRRLKAEFGDLLD